MNYELIYVVRAAHHWEKSLWNRTTEILQLHHPFTEKIWLLLSIYTKNQTLYNNITLEIKSKLGCLQIYGDNRIKTAIEIFTVLTRPAVNIAVNKIDI